MSPAVFRLANIMAHIDASDREIRQVNATLPQGRLLVRLPRFLVITAGRKGPGEESKYGCHERNDQ
jgi:hypothetical protein